MSQLSPETITPLMEFYDEKNITKIEEDGFEKIDEDWELLQFWYTKEIADKIILLIGNNAKKHKKENIALLYDPSLFGAFLRNNYKLENLNFALYEFYKRFSIFGENTNFYDLNNPLEIESKYHKNMIL